MSKDGLIEKWENFCKIQSISKLCMLNQKVPMPTFGFRIMILVLLCAQGAQQIFKTSSCNITRNYCVALESDKNLSDECLIVWDIGALHKA